ncbi:MAG TPA: acyl-CoA dehydrogenase family protein [Candidatus Krumholzibacteria bacterium]|nr:acyl-CoA dehydrogenase family protein [Candidatus Krumholzibacteria bacterium]
MDFSLTQEQTELRDAVIRFARRELSDDVIRRDKDGAFSREHWKKCAEFGIQGMPFPSAYGGQGMDLLATILALEAVGYACKDNGLGFGLGAQMWSVQTPINEFGTEEQKRRYLTKLCSGEWIGAHAMSEPDSGSDSHAMNTLAVRDGDHYVLNGSKTFVSSAPLADVFVTFATLGKDKGFLGITGFVVERETPGVRVSNEIEKMGLRTDPMAQVFFEDCRVPVGNRLGRDGQGAAIFRSSMEWERGCIFAPCVGAMQRQLEGCVEHARTRNQFGQPIGKFQAVANRLVDMRMRWEASRWLLYQMAWTKQRDGKAATESAIAKLHISESWVKNCLDAIQVHGGYGYTTEYELERDLRDAVGGTLYSGTSEIQRNLIARQLGL